MNYDFLEKHKIVPVVVLNKLEDTIPTLTAMSRGGIKVAEITFRTECAADAIKLASTSSECADILIGAGTVINADQCEKAISSGAKFIVSPGFGPDVAEVCKKHDVPYLPGVCTPTEIMAALKYDLKILKFFPAGAFGGLKTLKALSAAFPQVRFLPTGGVDASNMGEFFSQKFTAAVGGSWMVKGDLIAQGKFDEIDRLSREAVSLL